MRFDRTIRPRIALALSSVACLIGIWIVVPAPIYALLPLSVGAPEISPWLATLSLFALGLSAADRRTGRKARAAGAMAIAALVLPLWVLTGIPGTTREFDRHMADVLGPKFLVDVSPDVRGRFRRSPVEVIDLFRGLPDVPVQTSRGIVFATPGGHPLHLDVHRPADDGIRPGIIQIYGGGWRSGARTDNEPFARAMAAAGYVVVTIDYRHAPRWQWPAQLDDVRSAVSWTQAHAADHGIDAGRLVLLGRSSGAQLALVTAISREDPAVRAVVALFSPVNLTEGYRNPGFPDTLGLRALEAAFIGGTPDEKPDAYREASPITYARWRHPPALLMNGGRDRIVYPEYGAALHEGLRQSGTSVFLVMPWANHAFDVVSFGPSAQIALYYVERFVAWATRMGPDANAVSPGGRG